MRINYIDLLSWASIKCSEFSLVRRDEIDYNDIALSFEESLRPFLLKEGRVDRWPGTQIIGKNATLRLYRVCNESIQALKSVKGISYFVGPDYPEDLAFYANEQVVFASVAHEKMAWFE